VIVFRIEDPPPSKRPSGAGGWSNVIEPILLLLQQNVDQWCRVAEYQKQNQAAVTARILNVHPNVETASRTIEGKGVVFARWTS
jgi:hypothetical protein